MLDSARSMQRFAGKRPFVCVKNATLKFGGFTALDRFDRNVQAREVHRLMRENDSGKSTAIKILSGMSRAEPGTAIEIDGVALFSLTPAGSSALGIYVIYLNLPVASEPESG